MSILSATRCFLAACLLALPPLAMAPAHAQRGGIVDVPNNDPAMEAAKAEARASLPDFWKALEKPAPGEDMFNLKVSIPVGGNSTQHIWVGSIERLSGGRIAGRLGNVPRDIKDKKEGDRIEFEDKDVSDWMFMRNGKIVGNQTLRPLIARMPKAQADRYRAMLETP